MTYIIRIITVEVFTNTGLWVLDTDTTECTVFPETSVLIQMSGTLPLSSDIIGPPVLNYCIREFSSLTKGWTNLSTLSSSSSSLNFTLSCSESNETSTSFPWYSVRYVDRRSSVLTRSRLSAVLLPPEPEISWT